MKIFFGISLNTSIFKNVKKVIKVKKFSSLAVILLFILSNFAFAQYSDPSVYEGRPIDESREGRNYYREGQVIVYPAKTDSEERMMMERFAKGDISEEEIRKMAKSKFGENFDDEEFKKRMLETKERIDRKEAFSYENEGHGQRYYGGPSYEGYSKEEIVFGMVFQKIGDDIDPRDIKQHCNDPNKIADIVIAKFREKVGDLQKVCSQADEEESKCSDYSKKMCSRIGMPQVAEYASELEKISSVAYSCPVNKDAIIKACILKSQSSVEHSMRQTSDLCEKRFEHEGQRLLRECERFRENQVCDKDKFMQRCMGGVKKEDFEKPRCPETVAPACGERAHLKTKTDSNGCIYHYCEAQPETQQTCPADVQQCQDGSSVERDPANNCNFKPCPIIKCPESAPPACTSTQKLQRKTDDKGCSFYYCEGNACPAVEKPSCNSGEQLQANYDNAGCITGYQCIRTQICPQQPEKPSCSEGQSLTAKNDEKGCIIGYECISTTSNAITGHATLSTYEDYLRHCEDNWKSQERSCAAQTQSCDKNSMVERCKQQSTKNLEDYGSRIETECKIHTQSEVRAVEDRCSRIDKEKQKCIDQSSKRCGQMKGIAEKCRESLTEENLRKFVIGEAEKRCKFKDIVSNEEDIRKSDKAEVVLAVLNTAAEDDIDKLKLFVDNLKEDLKLQETTVYRGTIDPNRFGDIKLLPFVVNAKISSVESSEKSKESKEKIVARQKAEVAAGKLASLRDSNVPKEYLYIIEDKASEVLDVSDDLKEIEKKEEGKGVGYKIKLFLGMAKKSEQEEIKKLQESKSKLQGSIDSLAKLVDEIPSDVAKSILKEQVDNLKKQQNDIEILVEAKEKKSKGLFGLFG